MRTHAFLLSTLLATQALAHGGAPLVKYIRFPAQAAGAAWLMDELGLLAQVPAGFTWLCDDSVSPLLGFEVVAPVDDQNWVLSTRAGVFRSEDRGCSYVQVPGALTQHVTADLLPHPGRPQEMITATVTLGILNDVYRTIDGGRTWQPAGLESITRIRSFVRAEADPELVYASHGAGASRSDDGGASFNPIALGPPGELLPDGEPVRPEEFRFLGTSPVNRLEVVAIIERFPKSFLVFSSDGGVTWRHTYSLEDAPDSLAYSRDGTKILMSNPFVGLLRSTNGGAGFDLVPTPGIVGCLTREPGGDRIWACGRGRPIPWVAAFTENFGDSWEVRLQQYADLAGSWECPAGSPTAVACERQCPPAEPFCMPDLGLTDGAVTDAGLDAAPAADAEPGVDAAPPSARSGGGDCSVAGGGRAWPLMLLLGPWRRRPPSGRC